MPGAVAASRPIIADAEVLNGLPDFAGLTRRLIQAAQYSYARDLFYVPACPFPLQMFGSYPYIWYQSYPTVQNAVGQTQFIVGAFPVAEALTPTRQVAVRIYVTLSAADAVATFSLTPTVGPAANISVTYAALGSQLSGWLSTLMVVTPGSVVRGDLAWVSGGSTTLKSWCAWWQPPTIPGVSVESGSYYAVSSSSHADALPDSVATLRWMQRVAARLAYDRPRVLCTHAFPWDAGSIGKGPFRFKVPVSPGRDYFNLKVRAKTTDTSGHVTLTVGGTQVLDLALPNTSGAWTTFSNITSAMTPLGTPTDQEIVVQATGTAVLGSFSVQEYLAQVTMPGSEQLPGSGAFPSLNAAQVGAGSPVTALLRQAMISAFLYDLRYSRRFLVAWAQDQIPNPVTSGSPVEAYRFSPLAPSTVPGAYVRASVGAKFFAYQGDEGTLRVAQGGHEATVVAYRDLTGVIAWTTGLGGPGVFDTPEADFTFDVYPVSNGTSWVCPHRHAGSALEARTETLP